MAIVASPAFSPLDRPTLIKITPTVADDLEACQGLFRARYLQVAPHLGSRGGSCADTGLLAHAVIHSMEHDLLNSGTLTSPDEAIERTVRGFAFTSNEGRDQALRDIGPLISQYEVFCQSRTDRLVAAELDVTTTAEALPALGSVRVYLSGRIDRLAISLDGRPAITDWKTTRASQTADSLADRLSTVVYGVLALHHLRRIGHDHVHSIEFGICYLRSGLYVSTVVTLSQIAAAKDRVGLLVANSLGEATLVPGTHCVRCPCAGSCAAFRDAGWFQSRANL